MVSKNILVTGAAGFIGFHLCKRLLDLGYQVYGIDNLNAYYDVRLKLDRLKELGIDTRAEHFLHQTEVTSETNKNFTFNRIDLTDEKGLFSIFEKNKFDKVAHLAAQAGVRYSIDNPGVYIHTNVVGYFHILEACRQHKIDHLIYASSSSVYGNTDSGPLSEDDRVDHPVSLYAATKKSNELMAFTYSNVYNLPTTGLRFFTVYGPWGRPDMATFLFARSILKGEPIKVFNNGDLYRDFTYIDDIIEGVIQVILKKPGFYKNQIPYTLYNIGNHHPVKLMDFIHCMEEKLNKKAQYKMMPMQAGDVYRTDADVSALARDYDYRPTTPLDTGLSRFVEWYRSYYTN